MIYDFSFRTRLILCKEETFIISVKIKTGNEKHTLFRRCMKHRTHTDTQQFAIQRCGRAHLSGIFSTSCLLPSTHMHAHACVRKHTEM